MLASSVRMRQCVSHTHPVHRGGALTVGGAAGASGLCAPAAACSAHHHHAASYHAATAAASAARGVHTIAARPSICRVGAAASAYRAVHTQWRGMSSNAQQQQPAPPQPPPATPFSLPPPTAASAAKPASTLGFFRMPPPTGAGSPPAGSFSLPSAKGVVPHTFGAASNGAAAAPSPIALGGIKLPGLAGSAAPTGAAPLKFTGFSGASANGTAAFGGLKPGLLTLPGRAGSPSPPLFTQPGAPTGALAQTGSATMASITAKFSADQSALGNLTPRSTILTGTTSFADFIKKAKVAKEQVTANQAEEEQLGSASRIPKFMTTISRPRVVAPKTLTNDGRLMTPAELHAHRQEQLQAAKLEKRQAEAAREEEERILEAAALEKRIAVMTPQERERYDEELAEHERQLRRQRLADRRELTEKLLIDASKRGMSPAETEAYVQSRGRRTVVPKAASATAYQPGSIPLYLESIEDRISYMLGQQDELHAYDVRLHRRQKLHEYKQAELEKVRAQNLKTRPEIARTQSEHIARKQAEFDLQTKSLLGRRHEMGVLIDELANSLENTTKFVNSRMSHTKDAPIGAKITLLDGHQYALNSDSRAALVRAEEDMVQAIESLQAERPGMTPLAWWDLVKAEMEETQRTRLLELDGADEEFNLKNDVTAQQRENLARVKQSGRSDDYIDGEYDQEEDEDEDEMEEEENEDEEYERPTRRRRASLQAAEEDPLALSEFGAADDLEGGENREERMSLVKLLGEDEEDADLEADEDEYEAEDGEVTTHGAADEDMDEMDEDDEASYAPISLADTSHAALVRDHHSETRSRIQAIADARKREVPVFNIQTMSSLAEQLGVGVKQLASKLQELDLKTELGSQGVVREDVARLLVEEFGFTPIKGAQVVQPQEVASLRRKAMKTEQYLALPHRPPVITVSGHVDHGKTTLLDRLRSENRAAGEAGGITQAIGAFRVDLSSYEEGERPADALVPETDENGKPNYATFLDTPGHAAFKSMRAKGCSSSCTDMVILVISAADGLQPQSLEVIQLARQNNVPIIIAINKIDVPGADPDAIMQQLQVHDVVVESLGGEVLSCNISAKTGEGISELKELIRLTSEILQLHADRTCSGEAYVIESRVLKKGGCVANILVRNGSVRVGQHFVCGLQHGKIRVLRDENDRAVTDTVFPGRAVQLSGFKSLEDVTEDLYIVDSEEQALAIIADREQLLGIDESDLLSSQQHQTQVDQKVQAYKIQVTRRRKRVAIRPLTEEEQVVQSMKDSSVPVVVKADVSGSMEVLLDYFSKLPRDEVLCSIVKSGLGEITAADIEYASEIGNGASILGFNVKPTSEAVLLAKQKGIRIYSHAVIYSLWDDIRDLLSEKLPAEMEELDVGTAVVQQLFPMSGGGGKKKVKANAAAAADEDAPAVDGPAMVAGCRVKTGKLDSKLKFKIMRGDGEEEEVVFDGSCLSLRVNRDVKPFVEKGSECGIRLSSGSDSLVAVGDLIKCYTNVKKKKVLDDSAARGFVQPQQGGGANIHSNANFYA